MEGGNRTVGRKKNYAPSPTTARSAPANAAAVAGRTGLAAESTDAAKAAAGDVDDRHSASGGLPRRPTRRRRIRRVTSSMSPPGRGRGQVRPFGAADLAAVIATCHRPQRHGRDVELAKVAVRFGSRYRREVLRSRGVRRADPCKLWSSFRKSKSESWSASFSRGSGGGG